mmetsp:Transcript_7517/g.14647  ORF Transcript_7517/g.14647 Transcript_7517/m.14647 type:complete len:180 (-) Transcript_7517:269-808(-)
MACGKVACGICCGVTVVAIVLILFFFWPRNVEGCINTDDLAVTAWSLNSTSFAVAMSLPARVKNENYFAIDFDTIDVTAKYEGVAVAQGTAKDFTAESRGNSDLTVNLEPVSTSNSVASNLVSDCVDFIWQVTYVADVKLKAGGISFTFETTQDMPCAAGSASATNMTQGFVCKSSGIT